MITARIRHHPVLLGFLAAILVAATHTVATVSQSDPLDAVRARFAPDRRVAIFDVTQQARGDVVVLRGEVESPDARTAALEAVRASGVHRVIDEIAVLPDPKLGADTSAIVRVSVANVRGKPAHAAELVTQTMMGWAVRVLKEQSGWFLVHTEPDGYLGWIEDLQLARMTPAERDTWESSPLSIVTAPAAIVRDAPGAAANPVSDLVIGALVKSGRSTDGWTQVTLPDDRIGYVQAETIQSYAAWRAAVVPTAVGFARTARLFAGVPYLWGGTSPKGFDCSGFAKIVLRMNGIELPRDADQQAGIGRAVPLDATLSQLQPGDLLFFGPGATSAHPDRITHVGIHLGGLEFIHASGLVRRNSLDPASPIYSESLRARLLRVQRVLAGRPMTE